MNQPPVERYDPKTQWLHWTTAGLVALLWILGETIDFFPRGAPRVSARSAHICLGVVLAVVLLVRLQWRSSPARVAPPALGGRIGLIGSVMHRALYLLVGAVVLVGLLNAWERGDSIFGLFRIPSLVPENKPLRDFIEELHELAANALLVAALLHAAAALYHQFVRRDGVLGRMLPPR